MSALQYPTRHWSGAMPPTYAPRLVADFLDRHGAGLQNVCARVQNDAAARLSAVKASVALTPAQPADLAGKLEALAECLDAAQGRDDVVLPAGFPPRPDLDAALRWNIARLHDLAAVCRAV
ncbi:hypothetical protein [Rhodosalinus sediminis]|uniref:hypothetical protein n=1 Tax=Rhodosalinus sediminis TaxID=1940533 RepID=UPI00235606CE|nr:hypothetical protein [Rhodosalinus sediminis]